jgi:hypothetical protein
MEVKQKEFDLFENEKQAFEEKGNENNAKNKLVEVEDVFTFSLWIKVKQLRKKNSQLQNEFYAALKQSRTDRKTANDYIESLSVLKNYLQDRGLYSGIFMPDNAKLAQEVFIVLNQRILDYRKHIANLSNENSEKSTEIKKLKFEYRFWMVSSFLSFIAILLILILK